MRRRTGLERTSHDVGRDEEQKRGESMRGDEGGE